MNRWRALGLFLAALFLSSAAQAENDLEWKSWSKDLFSISKTENRFVILDLAAVWCHWCHVMEETTYRDKAVGSILKQSFVTVRADQDANPDLSSRYGDWGWPATIIFSPEGNEIVKRAGYIPPDEMVALLKAVIADPSPGPSVVTEAPIRPSKSHLLSGARRAELLARNEKFFDSAHAGWGQIHKFIDAECMDWELLLASKGDKSAGQRAERTLVAALNLIDRVEGGIYQYSDELDWKSPHYEKIMWYQANGLRQYAQAYAQWQDTRFLEAAQNLKSYLLNVLRSSEGAFFTSQDADVSETIPGKTYYALDQAGRDKLGERPRIDRHVYARENGWAIRGLAAYYAATGDKQALEPALAAAQWIVDNRANPGGGFRHDEADRSGPYLGDTLAMGQAALDLYSVTGERRWLETARQAGEFIIATFADQSEGFLTAARPEAEGGVFSKPSKNLDEQVLVARFANGLYRYSGDEKFRAAAEQAARYVTSDDLLTTPRPYPGALLVDEELSREPAHMTIVGRKDDPRAVALHQAALAYPAVYRRIDWWDEREGPLANADVQYPPLTEPAAFVCTDRICSLPIFDASELAGTVSKILSRTAAEGAKAPG